MPFAAVDMPSIALTQLASVLSQKYPQAVRTDVHYLNHDFYRHFGADTYSRISASVTATVSGLGDWLFQRAAFPARTDNAAAYRKRYSWALSGEPELSRSLGDMRDGVDGFLDALIDAHGLEHSDVVGLTSMFAQNMASFALARKLKERRPDIVIAMGGANCETSMGAVIAENVPAVDFVFSGPALVSFAQLVGHLMSGERERCGEIRGVFSARHAGNDAAIGEELHIDEVLPLDYGGFFASLEANCRDVEPSLLFETSRGCWWGERAHCTFCGLNGTTMSYRAMDPGKAVSQFEELFRHYPRVKRLKSVDNILPKEYLTEVLPRLSPPGDDLSIFYEIKADVNAEEMAVLAAAGVTELQPGIEALDTRTLRRMKKGTTAHQNLSFLKNCLRFGIEPIWNLLIGFPGEPEDVYRRYVEVLSTLFHLPPPTGVYPVRFDRYSPYFTRAEEFGLDLKPYDFYGLLYPFPEPALRRMAYFFADGNEENAYIENTARWLEPLETAVDQWNRRFRDGAPRLAWEGRGDARVVVDSRSGSEIEHELDPLERLVLQRLDVPTRSERLARELANVEEAEIASAVEGLRARSLVFEEEDRLSSLVVDYGRDEGLL